MNEITIRFYYSVEDIQGYDPCEWTEDVVAESIEEAILLAVDRVCDCASDDLTTVSYKIFEDGKEVLKTGSLSLERFTEACMLVDARRQRLQQLRLQAAEGSSFVIDDDDLPF